MRIFRATSPKHVVRALAFEGEDANGRDADGDTPLTCAIKRRASFSVIQELVRLGARTGLPDGKGATPLFLCMAHPDPNVLKHLLGVGTDPNHPRSRPTALHAAAYAGLADRIAMLLEAGADPNHQGNHGITPLFLTRDGRTARQLIQGGGDPHLRTRSGKTAIEHWRASQSNALDALVPATGRPPLQVIHGGH